MSPRRIRMRRDRRTIVLDVLLCARHPKSITQLLFDANLNKGHIAKFLNVMINDGYLEKRTVNRRLCRGSRSARRQRGLNPDVPTSKGRTWYKTSRKGEEYIADMKTMWEASDCHPDCKGLHSFDYTGRKHFMKPPITNHWEEGLDPAWVNEIYIPPVKLRSDMKLDYL